MKKFLALALMTVLASACASTLKRGYEDPLAKYDGYIGEPIQGFTAFRPYSWTPISDERMILWANVNDAYLLTFTNTCHELRFANTIGIDRRFSRIATLDAVMVGRQRCLIKQINPIDVRQMKADRAADAKSS